ncbi:MAG: Fur family transcriptional regulator [Elusimicrobia bacterium CG_4_9_14_3_um_filter_62_55]|nr:MAG: Fur family transcriptional regulator [Elusimicrobia bacterium CG22_combo_CG10-13_8_21_14_all_63_91]PJA13857.1 MAG: Fur family transcriptional regulator [Elusimicrobia bacterium CG_4_10_14_0_2_um_filter_63_34]PJB24282.1 MAG: Fur family transcriptional regulator [Elusimicrobia bacterium CG_4_9_14_3_um_filter_62_55]
MKKVCLSPAEIERRLEDANVRPTAQRIAVARYVLCEADHPTADAVKAWADANFPKMSLATVYNTLGILVKAGLLKEMRLPHTGKTVYDDNISDHYHFVDEKTGKLYDLDETQVQVASKLDGGFKVTGVDLVLRGEKR